MVLPVLEKRKGGKIRRDGGGGGAARDGDSRALARLSEEPTDGLVSVLGQVEWPSLPGCGLGGPIGGPARFFARGGAGALLRAWA